MKSIIMFPKDHKFHGYGYERVYNKVFSFKRNPKGTELKFSNSYVMNGISTSMTDVAREANRIHKQRTSMIQSSVLDEENKIFVVYNTQTSDTTRCMIQETSLASMVVSYMREYDIDVEYVRILDVDTNSVYIPNVTPVHSRVFDYLV